MGSEQNDTTSVPVSEPKLCANGCGFFGTAANMNMCSKCYRDLRTEEDQAASAKAAFQKTFEPITQMLIKPNPVVEPSCQLSLVEPVVGLEESSSSSELSSVANRCASCNKKVGLIGFKCKCGSAFCSTHRYPEKHQCGFDYKGDGRAKVAAHNPLIKADKLKRI